MTLTGLLLGPILCLAILLPPGLVLLAAIATTVFADGAIVGSGGRSISVEWFFALLVIGRALFDIALGRSGLRPDILQRLLPLLFYGLCCLASLLMALAWFQGSIIVLPGSAGLNPLLAEPYRLMPENLNQLIYLVLVIVLVYALVHLCGEFELDELARCIDRAMRFSCGLATLLVVWHIASITKGIWFPSAFLHSDASAMAWNQSVAGVQRPSGPFPEPSSLVYFYSAHLFYFWQRLRQSGSAADQLWLMVALGALLISTSTTAFLVLAAFGVLAAVDRVVSPSPAASTRETRKNLLLAYLLRTTLAIMAVIVVARLVEVNADLVDVIIDDQLLNKQQSMSYEVRANADQMAWQILLETGALGLGLGSHRASSGLLSLLIGPGIIGATAFLLFIGSALRRPACPAAAQASKPIRWSILGPLVCHAVTAPEFHSPALWIPVALSIGMHLKTGPAAAPVAVAPLPHAQPN